MPLYSTVSRIDSVLEGHFSVRQEQGNKSCADVWKWRCAVMERWLMAASSTANSLTLWVKAIMKVSWPLSLQSASKDLPPLSFYLPLLLLFLLSHRQASQYMNSLSTGNSSNMGHLSTLCVVPSPKIL